MQLSVTTEKLQKISHNWPNRHEKWAKFGTWMWRMVDLAEFVWRVFQVATNVYCFEFWHWLRCSGFSVVKGNWTSVRDERTTRRLLCNMLLPWFVLFHCCGPCPSNVRLLLFGGQTERYVLGTMRGFWIICSLRAQPMNCILVQKIGVVWIWNNPQWPHVVISDLRSEMES